MLVKPGLPLGCFQKTRATLPVAEFRKLLAADGSGVLTLRKTISHGNTRWQVSFQIDGRRRRRFFKTKAEAQSWLSELRWQSPVEQFWQSLAPIERQRVMLDYQLRALTPLGQGACCFCLSLAVFQKPVLRSPSLNFANYWQRMAAGF